MRTFSIGLLLLVLGAGNGGFAGEATDLVGQAAVLAESSTQREPGVAADEMSGLREVLVIGVGSDFAESSARHMATVEAERKMVQALQELAQELAGMNLSSRKAWLEWAWLLRQPGVRQEVTRTCQPGTVGPRATEEIRLLVPRNVLADWTARLEREAMFGQQARLFGGIATILLTVAALLTILVLDRRTGGYRRGLVVLLVMAVFGLLVAALWVLLVWAF